MECDDDNHVEIKIDSVSKANGFLANKKDTDVCYKGKLPKIIDNKHFAFVKTEESSSPGIKVIVAKCLLCPVIENEPDPIIRGDNNTQANFIRHLKRKHAEAHKEYEKAPKQVAVAPKQQTLAHFRLGVTRGLQTATDRLIVKYIVNGMKSLSTVEQPPFKELITGIARMCGEKVQVMSRDALTKRVSELHSTTVNQITKCLNEAPYICLTADAWSAHSKAFLGVTSHWITADLKRESAVLACSRFKGTHSFDRIAQELNKIIAKFSISKEKIVSVVTDNGSNFVKAFKEFGISTEEPTKGVPDSEDEENDEELTEDESGEEKVSSKSHLTEPTMIEIDGILLDMKLMGLPPHFKCASHTLSLIATKDVYEGADKGLYYRVIGKCTKLWNLSSSPKSAEKVVKICGKNFKRPCKTRWNSLFDSTERLLSMKSGLQAICEELSVTQFSDKELEFLEEFNEVSKPIACALDLLQGENEVFMGMTLPILRNLESMLIRMRTSTKYCEKFVVACLAGVQKRFGKLLEVNTKCPSDLVLAAVSHPSFKLRWLSGDLHQDMKQSFLNECTKHVTISISSSPEPCCSTSKAPLNPLLDFSNINSTITGTSQKYDVELEVMRFFNDARTNLQMLKDFPTVLKVFLHYNTALPSSAPVERLFSYAGLVLTSRRCSLKDKRFEQLVLLKCNSKFQL